MIINQIVAGGGSPAPSGKYQLLERVKDDTNTEIGTVCGFHTDANNVEYAVVCLDAQYRATGKKVLEYNARITDLPTYNNIEVYGAKETATFNCDKILAYSSSSPAVVRCRAQSFTISGVLYAGQLPTLIELIKIFEHRSEINTADTTAASNPTLIIPSATSTWSSTQYPGSYGSGDAWWVQNTGQIAQPGSWATAAFVIPILELPNQ